MTMRRCRAWLAAALLGFVGLVGWAAAQDVLPVPPLAGRVVDPTGTLSAAQSQALSDKLAAIESRRGSQIVVLIVPSTQPEDIAAYGQRVAEAWKIGRLAVGDGIVIVVAKNDRRVRIEVAKALEGAVPDLAAKQIISEAISPAFRAGDYAGGLNAALDRLETRIAGEGLPEPAAHEGANQGERGFDLQDLPMFLFIAVPIIGTVLSTMLGRKLGALATAGVAGGMGWWLTASLFAAAGAAVVGLLLVGAMGSRLGGSRRSGGGPTVWGGGGGGGGWSSGGGSSDGGGGFSSGGGGDFGGGGASGDW